MDFTPETIKAFFDENVPIEFQRETVRILKHGYEDAHRSCLEDFPEPDAHDLRPYLRRAMIERDWRQLAEFNPKAEADVRPNAANNCNHTLVRFGAVSMTVAFVDAKARKVRSAQYRVMYAATNQRMLFADLEPESPPAVYAILEHEGIHGSPGLLGQASWIFPDVENRVFARISLVRRFPELFTEDAVVSDGMPVAPEESYEDRAIPVIRRKDQAL